MSNSIELLTIMDPEECPDGDMYRELNWFETICRIKKISRTTEDRVRAFLQDDRGRPDLADQFKASYLLPASSQ